jgi:hypothetical protein
MDDILVLGEPAEQLKNVCSRVRNIEAMLKELVTQKHIAGDYTVSEFAEIVSRSDYTVREWCRLSRINAKKIPGARRGGEEEWRIARSEYERYRNEGVLPLPARK